MQFQVPQFTEIEDKVIGPFTLKQFLYLLAGGAILFILFKLVRFGIFIILAIPIAGITIALAFIKINNQPFVVLVKNLLGFLKKPDFYVWKKKQNQDPIEAELNKPEELKIIKKTPTKTKKTKKFSKHRLQEMDWKINVEK